MKRYEADDSLIEFWRNSDTLLGMSDPAKNDPPAAPVSLVLKIRGKKPVLEHVIFQQDGKQETLEPQKRDTTKAIATVLTLFRACSACASFRITSKKDGKNLVKFIVSAVRETNKSNGKIYSFADGKFLKLFLAPPDQQDFSYLDLDLRQLKPGSVTITRDGSEIQDESSLKKLAEQLAASGGWELHGDYSWEAPSPPISPAAVQKPPTQPEEKISDDEKKRAAERRWQYIQSHPIRGVEILFMLKGAVGFDWFRKLLEETRLSFSRDEPSFKLGQLLGLSHEPNTKEPSPKMEKPICSFWEIYEPEKGYWFKKITPAPRAFSTVAGFDAATPWPVLGVSRVEKLQDIGMLTEVGVSIPCRAYQIGVEEFEVRFIGDTFSFSVKLSDHALDGMHFLACGFASAQESRGKDEEPIPVGTSFGGVQLLEMFYQQLLPRRKDDKSKPRGGIAGMCGPGGKAISFFPCMPLGYTKTIESKEYSFTITTPPKIDAASRIKELEAKLKANPADAKSYAELAAVYCHEGRLQDALRCLETGMKKSRPAPDVLGMTAQVLSKMGRFDEALVLYRKAEKLCREGDARIASVVQNKLGICLHELGKDEEALLHFQAAARSEPLDVGYQINLSMAFAAVKRYSDALVPAIRAVELAPDDHRSAIYLGVLLTIVDRTADAIPHFERATQLSPDSAEAHGLLGEHLAKLNDHESAVESLSRAVKIKETATGYDLLAASLSKLNRWPEAETAFRRVAKLEPNNSQALANIGATLANQNKLEEALQFFEQAVSANLDNTDAQQKLAGLREIMARR